MTRRGITTWLAGYLAGCLVTGATIGALHRYSAEPVAATVVCQEDDPCWDCSTMGNLICGTR